MELRGARALAGEDPFSFVLPDERAYVEWLRRAADWQLLLQLDSDQPHTNMLWADAGPCY